MPLDSLYTRFDYSSTFMQNNPLYRYQAGQTFQFRPFRQP